MTNRLATERRIVRQFRNVRDDPPDLGGRRSTDRLLSWVTGRLDRHFATLELSNYEAVPRSRRVRSRVLVLTQRKVLCASSDVVSLTFEAPSGEPLTGWEPGSHIDITLPSGLRRSYSLCGNPDDSTSYTIAVREMRSGSGASSEAHRLPVGAEIAVSRPINAFPFVGYRSAHFIAGGIGITPIISMVRRARALELDWHLTYSGRSTSSMPFLDEIGGWDTDRVTIRSDDVHGTPSAEDLLGLSGRRAAVFCCGPPTMIDGVRREMKSTPGVGLHVERFSSPVIGGNPFTIELSRTGISIDIPADRSALDMITALQPRIPYSCRQGFCGTCRTRVIAGVPEHRGTALTNIERDTHMLICVSRATSNEIVLDL